MIGLPNVPYSQTPIDSSSDESCVTKCTDIIGTGILLIEFSDWRVDVFPVKQADNSDVLITTNACNKVVP